MRPPGPVSTRLMDITGPEPLVPAEAMGPPRSSASFVSPASAPSTPGRDPRAAPQ